MLRKFEQLRCFTLATKCLCLFGLSLIVTACIQKFNKGSDLCTKSAFFLKICNTHQFNVDSHYDFYPCQCFEIIANS